MPSRHQTRPGARPPSAVLTLGLSLLLTACVQAEPPPEETIVEYETQPGALPYPAELRARLAAAVEARGPDYQPRTEHHKADGTARFTNRLILEDSPYLLQHAHNPVDWYPWGAEAFERARREGKPIFLSIGYSTCHWCHVMERESFESLEIAELMNRHFINVKVDREQRPDVDEFYMTAVQLQTRRGGWPMSSFLTPDGKPFYSGSYFPPPRFTMLLEQVADAWRDQRPQLEERAEMVTKATREVITAAGEAEKVGRDAVSKAVAQLRERYDPTLGGFGGAPKFPHEPELLFLLDHALRTRDADALEMATRSLDAMARGGIYDQVGGGFHRYSTDERWLVPHFEKMLYNQAHLSRAYLDAYALTGDAFFLRVARQTLDYVRREMTAPGGGFYSATDADSEGEEGLFFVWTPAELRALLGEEDAAFAIELWGVSEHGNFEGKNILYLRRPLAESAAAHGTPEEKFLERVDRIRETLWQAREKREHPIRDDKILTAWNGMMITAFAEAAALLGDAEYLAAAEQAAEFLWRENRRAAGELWRVHLDGRSSVPGLQNDYAHLAEAFLALHDATGETKWLERARELADAMLAKFWDAEAGGFYMGAEDADPYLIARPKSPTDGAIPSGNSVAMRVLALLARRTGEMTYAERASATLNAFAGMIERFPSGLSYLLLGAEALTDGEAGPLQYGAAGKVRAKARVETAGDGERELVVELAIADGWHVNSDSPLQEDLIPTVLSLDKEPGPWRLGEVRYPEAKRVTLSFQDEPLAVYEGEVALRAPLASNGEAPARPAVLPVRLGIQACDDRVCLKPEEMVLELPMASLGS